MEIICQPLGPVQANCYIVIKNQHALVIDPGDIFPELSIILKEKKVKLDAILLTHAHFDHIGGVDALVKEFSVPVYLHPAEFSFLNDSRLNASQSFYQDIHCHANPEAFKEGIQTIGKFDVDVKFTPGHSVGSVTIGLEDCLFTGDTLFQGSVGRMDLPTGNVLQMKNSIAYFKSLDGSFKIYPGHGPSSILDYEKKWNPYFN